MAATDLLGSGPHRWAPINQRQAFAGDRFEITVDGFRRRRSDGSSRETDTYEHLVEAILEIHGPSRPTGDSKVGHALGPHRRRIVIGAGLLAASVAAFVYLSSGSGPNPHVAAESGGQEEAVDATGTVATPTTASTTRPPVVVDSDESQPASPAGEVQAPAPCPFAPCQVEPGSEPPRSDALRLISEEAVLWEATGPVCALSSAAVLGAGRWCIKSSVSPERLLRGL